MIFIKKSGNRLAEFYEEGLLKQTTSPPSYQTSLQFIVFLFIVVSSMENALLQKALKTTNAEIYENEDFLELSDRFNCRSRVHPLNVYGVIFELA